MCVLVHNITSIVSSPGYGWEGSGEGQRFSPRTYIYTHNLTFVHNIIYVHCNIVCVYIYGAAADAVWSLALNESRRLIGFDSVT